MKQKINIGTIFFLMALLMLISGVIFGVFSAQVYIFPNFFKNQLGFETLRPLHVSSVLLWILLGSTGSIFLGLHYINKNAISKTMAIVQIILWSISIIGIMFSYSNKIFGGREYWEFNPIWALPIAIAWILFIINFFKVLHRIPKWPVYIWMWMTGIIFFLFTFIENYLWIFPYFRQHFITDMTIQWKVNGSLVGSWNQILYGMSLFLMDKINNKKDIGRSRVSFAMYFLGFFNLLFNWGHHIYTLPTESYIRQIGYLVSMTEWIFIFKIIYSWRETLTQIQKQYHHFPYRFLMAMEFWVFANMLQAICMSIPAFNIFSHGTHITVAHAMGTTIGINTMILLAVCFEFFIPTITLTRKKEKCLNFLFWGTQISLFCFWINLNIIGIKKGLWQMKKMKEPFSTMMNSLHPLFQAFNLFGIALMFFLAAIAITLLIRIFKQKKLYN